MKQLTRPWPGGDGALNEEEGSVLGRFISTHSVALVLPMHIAYMPERGGSVHADAASSRPGGGFTTLCAAAAMGGPAAAASPLGTGPNSFAVRQQLVEAGVDVLTPELVGDIGVVIQLIVEDGSMRSVVTAGVESEPSRDTLEHIKLREGDVIHVAASDMTSAHSASELSEWASSLPPFVTLVVSVSPAVAQVPVEAWETIFPRADIVTMNSREAAALGSTLDAHRHGSTIRSYMRADAATVRRVGERGCELQLHADAPVISIPAFDARIADTAGVGDTHIAEMCAGLLLGYDLETACLMANAGAALAISHESALPVPTRDQVENVLETGVVTNILR